MSQQYPGGLITKSPPATVGPTDGEGGSAPGVWTLDQAMALKQQSLWPKPLIQGRLWAWGNGNSGQLGENKNTNRSSPVQVGSLATWSQIAGGAFWSIAIKTDGTMWSWGRNTAGQLGQDSVPLTGAYLSSPVQIGALTTWSRVSAGGSTSPADNFCVAIKTDGTLWSWGAGTYGRTGHNDVISRSSPVQVGALTTWSQIAGGGPHCLAIKTDGTLWTWGNNSDGELGQNDEIRRSSPVQIGALTTWSKIAAGNNFSLAIKTDGTMWSWGANNNAQLGLNNTVKRSSPVQVGALTTWSQIGAGYGTSRAIKTDGALWAWGRNDEGQCGLNDYDERSSPTQVGALTTWSQIGGGQKFSLAIKTDGTLWSWGKNDSGQLGINSTSYTSGGYGSSSPVQVGALTTWLRLPKLSTPNANFSLAIKS